MKKSFILISIAVIISLFSTNKVYAHFGSKGPFGGYVTCSIVYDSIVYLGTANGGVYQSSNSNLLAWTARPVGLKSGKISALAHSGAYLFAGTLDSGVYIFNGYVGTDRHWIKINKGLGSLKIKSLLALDSITLLLGTEGGGLYKTTDRGANWTAINASQLNNSTITAMVKMGNRIVASTLTGGIFASNDGNSWTNFNDVNTLNIAGTVGLAYNSTTNELAVINKNGVFILANANTTTTLNYVASQTGLTAGTTLRNIVPNGTNWYLATDKGVFTSTTGTINWASANAGLKTNDVVTIVPFRTSLIVGTNKEGVFKTAASTIAWVANNTSYNNVITYSMETSGVAVVVAATENGVFVSTDLAATYVSSNKGLTDSLNVTYLKFLGSNLYATTKNGGVFMSADTGKTWTAVNYNLTNLNTKELFASSTNLYLLDNNNNLFQYIVGVVSNTWVAIQTGLSTGSVPTSMAFYGSKMLLGTMGQGVFTRDIAGGTWASANTGLSNLNVTSVTTNGNGSKLFVGTEGSGVFVSDAASPSWKTTAPLSIDHTILMGLDGTKIQEMANYGSYVYASYRGGLLASSDNSVTWIAGGNQFNLPSFTSVNRIAFVTTRVFVTTENNALYSNSLSELPVVSGLDDFNAALNASVTVSPNPNNGQFLIELKDINSTIKSVGIYNSVGQLLQQLIANNSASINVSANYPTGIYFIKIATDNGIAVKKVVVE